MSRRIGSEFYMTDDEMIAWLKREKAETLLECRRELFQRAIDKINEKEPAIDPAGP